MNWKLFIGQSIHQIGQLLIKSNSSFINKNFPYGHNWLFDIKRSIKTNPLIIIDAGANVGSVSLELHYWFPNAVIYAFEPIKSTFDILTKNTAVKNSIKPFQLALGSKNESLEILISGEHTINSLKVTETHKDIVGTDNRYPARSLFENP